MTFMSFGTLQNASTEATSDLAQSELGCARMTVLAVCHVPKDIKVIRWRLQQRSK